MTTTSQPTIMDGTSVARSVVSRAADRAAEFARLAGRKPCLAAVIVGQDAASLTYVKMKQNRCRSTGIDSRVVTLPDHTSTAELVATLHELSSDTAVDGILLQHPVPPTVDERAAFEAIAPDKDVDGVTMRSFAAMALDTGGPIACTPGGIIRLLDAYRIDPAGRHAVVIGRSPILGKPVGMLLVTRNATVTFCHSHTRHLSDIVQSADIVVAAVGRPNFVRGLDQIRSRGDRCRLQPRQRRGCGLRRGSVGRLPHHSGPGRGGPDDDRHAPRADGPSGRRPNR